VNWLRRWLERRCWTRVAVRVPAYDVRVMLIEAATGAVWIGRWNEAGMYPDDHFVYWRPLPEVPYDGSQCK
jgi:hypothetical protein